MDKCHDTYATGGGFPRRERPSSPPMARGDRSELGTGCRFTRASADANHSARGVSRAIGCLLRERDIAMQVADARVRDATLREKSFEAARARIRGEQHA